MTKGHQVLRVNDAPILLDLFCGAGGAAMGYWRAGFDVVGVDIEPQPRYPFHFIQADALKFVAEHGWEYDAIHASPPCQGYTPMSNRWRGKGHGTADAWPKLIPAVRAALEATGKVWVIENVVGAKNEMRGSILLRGGMFGLGVDRPRRFLSNARFMPPPPVVKPEKIIGVYGAQPDGRRLCDRRDGTTLRAAKSVEEASAAMQIDWMNWRELAESIPPAYTKWIGLALRVAVDMRKPDVRALVELHRQDGAA